MDTDGRILDLFVDIHKQHGMSIMLIGSFVIQPGGTLLRVITDGKI